MITVWDKFFILCFEFFLDEGTTGVAVLGRGTNDDGSTFGPKKAYYRDRSLILSNCGAKKVADDNKDLGWWRDGFFSVFFWFPFPRRQITI